MAIVACSGGVGRRGLDVVERHDRHRRRDERDVRAEPGELRGIDVPVLPEIVQTAAIAGPNQGTIPATSGFTLYRVRGTTIDDGTFVPLD